MSQEVGALHYDLDIDDKKLTGALDGADKKVEGFGAKVSKHWEGATAASQKFMLGIAAVGAATVAFGVQSVKAYNDATEATTKLRTNLLNVKGATDEHVKSLEKQASKLQSIGVIEDDVIKAGMSQLATFNLQGKTIEKVTPKIADMVAQLKGHNATSEDMVGINNLVGKVLTGNVGALSRYGVTLDENQKKVLENGTEAEKAAKLVEVLSQNYGNVNEKLRQTPQGQITALKNAFGDLQEGVGELIMGALAPLVGIFSTWLSKVEEAGGFLEYFKKLVSENQEEFKMLAAAVVAMVVPALIAMAVAAAPTLLYLAALAAIGVIVYKVAKKLGIGMDDVSRAFEVVKGWIDNVKLAIQLLVAGFKEGDVTSNGWHGTMERIGVTLGIVWGWILKVKDAMLQVVNFLISLAIPIWNILKGVFDFLLPPILALISTLWDRLLPALMDIWSAVVKLWNALNPALMIALGIIAAVIGGIVVVAIWLFINILNIVISVISFVINIIATLIGWFANLIGWIGNVVGAFVNMVREIIGWFSRIPENVKNIVNGIVDWFRRLPDMIRGAIGGVTDTVTAPFKAAFNAIARFWNNSIGKLSFTAPDWVPAIGGKGFSMPKLPELATGGITTGPVIAQIGEAGTEAVLPLSYMNRYTNLFDRIESTVQDITSSGVSGGAGGASITMNFDGVIARSGSELRDIIKEGIGLVNQELRAKGKTEISI